MVDLPWRLVCLGRPREQSTRGSLPGPLSSVPGTPEWVELRWKGQYGAVEIEVRETMQRWICLFDSQNRDREDEGVDVTQVKALPDQRR
jgi:hypothetical protein